ncbi:late control protein [Neisseria brasiliensis]|uniref:contractile injection system protein, VgrG/Pvc8 family n=1 Tax=Neisseria TaxID=482 RepID=UPI000C27983E|nr:MULTISPECIES: contractile injection system protein, VgrG/Pvc8 family [Neisseria]PJO77109.1 late control protein [Neisseria sp. N177_16]QGL24224.1 late control protein [Neisseria brasiliensis]
MDLSNLGQMAKDAAVKVFSALTDTGGNHLTPVAILTIDGKPFGTDALSRIISLNLADKRGFEADELTITLDDSDGLLALPPKSAEITVQLGYMETGVVDKGKYKIAEVTWSGAPDTISITAHSADVAEKFAESVEKSWHKQTIKAIVEQIAQKHGYQPIIGKAFAQETIDHIDQSNESDAAFLSRLAQRYDAIATVKGGRLLFVSAGEATTANGEPLPAITLTRHDGDSFNFRYSATESYNAVRAYYIDKKTGKKQEIVIAEGNYDPVKKNVTTTRKAGKTRKTTTKQVEETKKIDTTGHKIKTLRHTYQSAKTAATGARAAYRKLKRGAMEFDMQMAVGRPDVAPESPVTLKGFKKEVDAESWVGVEVAHTLDSGGLTTKIKLESLIDFEITLYEGEATIGQNKS